MLRCILLFLSFLFLANACDAQTEVYTYPGSSSTIGTQCRYFRNLEDFLQNKNADSAVFAIHMVSDLSFEVKAFLDKPERWEINDFYCIITSLDTLFNLKNVKEGRGYSKRIVLDSFHIVFKPKDNKYIYASYGLLGAAIGSALESNNSMRTNLTGHTVIAVNQNSGKKIYLTKFDLRYHLRQLQDEKILEAFQAEKDYTLEVMLRYFQYYLAHRAPTSHVD